MVEAESERVVSFDPNIRDVLIEEEAEYRAKIERAVAASTIVKISDEDMAWINPSDDPGRGAAAVLDRGARLVLVTSGEGGAFARTSRAEARLPAVPVQVSDTIGAGDSFHAAVLAWLHHMQLLTRDAIERLSQSDLERMLRFCTTVAAATCSRPGSDPPKLSELDAEVVTWNR
jgi:fructokinase